MGRVYQIHIATYVSPAQVYTRDTKREHTNGFRMKHLFLSLQFFGATAEFQ